jgi:hypothetical protein
MFIDIGCELGKSRSSGAQYLVMMRETYLFSAPLEREKFF